MEKILFVSEVATGCIKLLSGLSGTVSFLQVHGSIYNSFIIRAQSIEKAHISSRCRRQSILSKWLLQCDLYHWKRSTRDWKCYERIMEKYRPLRQRTVRAKLPRTRQGLYHRPFKRRNKIPPKWTCLRDWGTILTWRSTNRALQRQRSRSSYFRRWECDRCHIF